MSDRRESTARNMDNKDRDKVITKKSKLGMTGDDQLHGKNFQTQKNPLSNNLASENASEPTWDTVIGEKSNSNKGSTSYQKNMKIHIKMELEMESTEESGRTGSHLMAEGLDRGSNIASIAGGRDGSTLMVKSVRTDLDHKATVGSLGGRSGSTLVEEPVRTGSDHEATLGLLGGGVVAPWWRSLSEQVWVTKPLSS